jgi:hypothetical protein
VKRVRIPTVDVQEKLTSFEGKEESFGKGRESREFRVSDRIVRLLCWYDSAISDLLMRC